MDINCEICDKTFTNGTSLIKHYYYHIKKEPKRKNEITSFMADIRKKKNNQCLICKKIFNTKQNLENHLAGVCRPKQLNIMSKNSQRIFELSNSQIISNTMKNELQKLSNENVKILNIINNSANIYINNNTTNNFGDFMAVGDNNNINNNTMNKINNNFSGVRSANIETVDMYDRPLEEKDQILRIFQNKETIRDVDQMFLSIDKFFNCNRDYPENHNIIITDKRQNVPCMVKIDDAWTQQNEVQMKKFFYERIVNCKELYATYIPNKLKEVLPTKAEQIDRMTDFIIDKYSDENDEIKERLWYQFFLQTYDHRDIILETYERDQKLIKERDSPEIEFPPLDFPTLVLPPQIPANKKPTKMRIKKKSSIEEPVIMTQPTYQVKSL